MTSLGTVFEKGWPHPESLSGPGSTRRATRTLREQLPAVLANLAPGRAVRINDAGCGDMAWMPGIVSGMSADYQGYDVVEWPAWPALRTVGWKLDVLDICSQPMREADVTVCRGVMIHLPNDMCLELIRNIARSSRYLLASTYVSGTYGSYCREFSNDDRIRKPTRGWSRIDLTLPPFSLGQADILLNEAHDGKYLGLWYLPEIAQ